MHFILISFDIIRKKHYTAQVVQTKFWFGFIYSAGLLLWLVEIVLNIGKVTNQKLERPDTAAEQQNYTEKQAAILLTPENSALLCAKYIIPNTESTLLSWS